MRKFRFPVVTKKKTSFPGPPVCPVCKKTKVCEPYSFTTLIGGACLQDRKGDPKDLDQRLEGFLSIDHHGKHDALPPYGEIELGAIVDIAKDTVGGQFDLYFCSPKCLRRFLNSAIDELEHRLKEQRRRRSLR